MDDVKLALLGDKEAAKRLTEKGVLIPCAWCGKTPSEDDLMGRWNEYILYHDCKKAGPMRVKGEKRFDVCLAWNTRAPILSAAEMEMLEGMEGIRPENPSLQVQQRNGGLGISWLIVAM